MPFIKTFFVFFITIVFSACATTEQGMKKLDSYIGKNADDFFKNYGIPMANYQFQDESRVYRWSSGLINYQMPTTTIINSTRGPIGNSRTTATTTGGGIAEIECIVEIYTDQHNTIQYIKPIKDTTGTWVTSRCAEVF